MPDWLHVTYRVAAPGDEIEARAKFLALEQSVEMLDRLIADSWVLETIVGRVEEIEAVIDRQDQYLVSIALSAITVGTNPAQLLSMLFGNCSLQNDVELLDAYFPAPLVAAFPGPRHGDVGIRRLVGSDAAGRALTCTALKPQGASTADLAALCRLFAGAGIDIVKDDHGLADQITAPFAERVRACQDAVAGTGTLYAPSVVGPPRRAAEMLAVAAGEGVQVALVAPMLCGLPAFLELVADHPGIAFLGHPAFGGAGRIAPAFLFGTLFRLFGADAVIFPSYGGRFAYTAAECAALADRARRPWLDLPPVLPVPAGGMTVERVPEMLDFYGPDIMLLISGGLLDSGDVATRAREFVAAVHQ